MERLRQAGINARGRIGWETDGTKARLAFEAAPLHAVTALLFAPVCGALASWYAARRVV